MLHVDVESILQNTDAFKILEEGGHPTEFFAHLNISVAHHVTLYHEHDGYKTAFDIACTKALSILRAYGRELFAPTAEKEAKPYDDILALEHKQTKKRTRLNEEFNIYKHYIEDLESYMPAIKKLKTEAFVPSTPEDERTFYVTFAPSTKPDEDHGATNPST